MTEQLFNSQQPQQGRWLEWAVPAVLDLVGTLFTNSSNSNNVDKQNAFNMAMQDKQNEYNSPLNQKRLYEQAGINPGFLFGGQSGLDSTSGLAQSAGIPTYEKPDFNSIARNLFESKRLQNETLKNDADIQRSNEETESYKIANQYAHDRNAAEIKEIKSRTDLSDAEKDLRIAQKESELQRKEELFQSAENFKYNVALLKEKAKSERWTQKRLEAEYDKLLEFKPVELNLLKSQYHLNESQAALAKKSIENIASEIKKRVKDGELVDAEIIGQIIDNVVKDAKSEPEIIEAMIKAENPIDFILLDHSNGMLQNTSAFIATQHYINRHGNVNSLMRRRAREFKYNRSSPTWLFSK